MSILYLKSLLSLLGIYTMFEFYGRKEKKFSATALKRIHRWNGYLFLLLFLVIAYLCLDILAKTRMALDSRIMFHAVLALAVLLLLLTKIAYVRVYKLFYAQARIMGPVIGLLAIGLTAISGGYYLLVNGFGTVAEAEHAGHEHEQQEHEASQDRAGSSAIKPGTDQESIEQGKALYREKCIFCHDPHSRKKKMGPGHENILGRDTLPVSGRPATPENIVSQLRDPYQNMPPFPDLSRKQVEDLLAYLNTL